MGAKGGKEKHIDIDSELDYIIEKTGWNRAKLSQIFHKFSAMETITIEEFVPAYSQLIIDSHVDIYYNLNEYAKRVFKFFDVNNDGSITFKEFVLTVYLSSKAPKEEKLEYIFQKLDVDKNGTLSTKEISQLLQRAYEAFGFSMISNIESSVFERLDQDGNSEVNSEEFISACLNDQDLCKFFEENIGVQTVVNELA